MTTLWLLSALAIISGRAVRCGVLRRALLSLSGQDAPPADHLQSCARCLLYDLDLLWRCGDGSDSGLVIGALFLPETRDRTVT
jgi:hypothetical protein